MRNFLKFKDLRTQITILISLYVGMMLPSFIQLDPGTIILIAAIALYIIDNTKRILNLIPKIKIGCGGTWKGTLESNVDNNLHEIYLTINDGIFSGVSVRLVSSTATSRTVLSKTTKDDNGFRIIRYMYDKDADGKYNPAQSGSGKFVLDDDEYIEIKYFSDFETRGKITAKKVSSDEKALKFKTLEERYGTI